MSHVETIRLSDYLRNETGNRVRSVIHYDADGYEIEYARDDSFTDYTADELAFWIDQLREDNEVAKDHQNRLDHGELMASVKVFEDVVGFHFPNEDGSGTVVTLDSSDVDNLQDFVGSCLTVLHQTDDELAVEDSEGSAPTV